MKNTIKTLAVAFCAALTLSLAACTKSAEDLIIGTWQENEITYTVVQGGETMSMPMLEPNETAEITFNEDGTYSSIYHSEYGDADGHGTWSIKDEKLTITEEGTDPMVYTIDKIDKKVCNLTYTESGEDEDGPYTTTIVLKMTRK